MEPRGQRHRGVVETIEKADGTRHRHHQIPKSQDVRVDDCGLLDHATSVGELRDLAATLNLSTDELRGGLLGWVVKHVQQPLQVVASMFGPPSKKPQPESPTQGQIHLGSCGALGPAKTTTFW